MVGSRAIESRQFKDSSPNRQTLLLRSLAAEQFAREEEALRAVEEASLLHLPAGSDVPISALDDLWRREQMMMQRIERENTALQQDLAQHEAALAAREKAHDERVSKFEQEKANALAQQADVAFLTARQDDGIPSRKVGA